MPTRKTTFSTTELARHIGCSAKFLRDEIASGNLRAARIGHGEKAGTRFVVAAEEAHRYCKQLGLPPMTESELPPAVEVMWSVAREGRTPACLIRDGVVADANDALAAVSGYSKEQMVGKPTKPFFVAPSQAVPFPDGVHQELVQLRHNSGRVIQFILTRIPVPSDHNYVTTFITPVDPAAKQRT